MELFLLFGWFLRIDTQNAALQSVSILLLLKKYLTWLTYKKLILAHSSGASSTVPLLWAADRVLPPPDRRRKAEVKVHSLHEPEGSEKR